MRCERTAKIKHLFQSSKHFFKNFRFSTSLHCFAQPEEFRAALGLSKTCISRMRSSFLLNVLANACLNKNGAFLECGCKGNDKIRTCKQFINFFQKNAFLLARWTVVGFREVATPLPHLYLYIGQIRRVVNDERPKRNDTQRPVAEIRDFFLILPRKTVTPPPARQHEF